jgi:hypothetical protein
MRIVHKAVYTCEEASRLIVQKKDNKLNVKQRIRLWMHLAICSACKRFDIHNAWLDKQLHNMDSHDFNEAMPAKSKQKIAAALLHEKTKNAQ